MAFAVFRVVDVDHQWRVVEHADGGVDHVEELAVGNQRLGFAMLQHKGDGFGIQTHVQWVEHCADHRHAKVRFEHFRNVWQHHGYRVAFFDPAPGQRRGQAPAARVGGGPVAADGAMHHGWVLRINRCRALDKA